MVQQENKITRLLIGYPLINLTDKLLPFSGVHIIATHADGIFSFLFSCLLV